MKILIFYKYNPYEKFIKNTNLFILPPIFFSKQTRKNIKDREFDLLLIGFKNPFNIEGINCFFNNVYTLIRKKLKTLIVGEATKYINVNDYSNVSKIQYTEDFYKIYKNTKLSIVPLLRGTRTKIKVLESLSFGVPDVTTFSGVSRLFNKFDNGCNIADNEFEFSRAIENVLDDIKYYKTLRLKGIKYIKKYYSHNKFTEIIRKIL